MINKLIKLLSQSNTEVSELLQELNSLQNHFKEKVRERRTRIEKERCYVMHEMKNALSGILSCAHVLHDEKLTQEDLKEFLRLIGNEIERIVELAQALEDRVCPSASSLRLQRLSANTLLGAIMPFIMKHVLAVQGIALEVDTRYAGEIQVDVEKIQQAFMNIIYNARDAMPNGGSLTIRSRLCDDETVCLEFHDTGCGMSADMVEHIFEPLVTEGKPFGTGMGMAIVKEIVDEHQGRVRVESQQGEGTTVRILLPISQNL